MAIMPPAHMGPLDLPAGGEERLPYPNRASIHAETGVSVAVRRRRQWHFKPELTLAGPLGYTLLVFIWLFALSGILFKIKFGNKYKKTSLATYLGMGFISLGMLGELYEKLPEQAIGLLALGGLIYTLGVFFYVKKTVPYTHAIWHLFVLGGVTCHFLMIYWYV